MTQRREGAKSAKGLWDFLDSRGAPVRISSWLDVRLGEKRESGENEIPQIPQILKILIPTKTRSRQLAANMAKSASRAKTKSRKSRQS